MEENPVNNTAEALGKISKKTLTFTKYLETPNFCLWNLSPQRQRHCLRFVSEEIERKNTGLRPISCLWLGPGFESAILKAWDLIDLIQVGKQICADKHM